MGKTNVKYSGNKPKNGKRVLRLQGWDLYLTGWKGDYRNYKLVSTVPREKANYWIGFNSANGKMVKHRDVRLLQDHLRVVYDKVHSYMLGVVS